jgi:hypothetical protein
MEELIMSVVFLWGEGGYDIMSVSMERQELRQYFW